MNTMLSRWLKQHIFWLLLIIVCLLAETLGLADSLRFDRGLIDQGHLWLLLSGHFVHLNAQHLWLNQAGLVLVMVFFSRYCSVLIWSQVIIISALFVALGLYWLNEDIIWYVGLSGVLHGLFIVGAWYEMKQFFNSGLVLLLLVIAKLTWEQVYGPMPGSESMTGGHVAVDAHFYGALGGVLFLLLHKVVHINNGHQDRQYNEQNNNAHENNQ
ncbi:MAG: rhombosortase [Gammaproteobacteria bacterium]|nr:rhombosortase [Gammaproteobacteria bacterium]